MDLRTEGISSPRSSPFCNPPQTDLVFRCSVFFPRQLARAQHQAPAALPLCVQTPVLAGHPEVGAAKQTEMKAALLLTQKVMGQPLSPRGDTAGSGTMVVGREEQADRGRKPAPKSPRSNINKDKSESFHDSEEFVMENTFWPVRSLCGVWQPGVAELWGVLGGPRRAWIGAEFRWKNTCPASEAKQPRKQGGVSQGTAPVGVSVVPVKLGERNCSEYACIDPGNYKQNKRR